MTSGAETDNRHHRRVAQWYAPLVAILLALPWLNPYWPGPSVRAVQWIVTLASVGLAIGILAVGVFRVVQVVWIAAASWLIAAAFSSAIGVLQYLGYSSEFAVLVARTPPGEAFANLLQRNSFATLTNMGLAAAMFWQVRGDAPLRALGHLGWRLPIAVLVSMGNAASGSRTGFLEIILLLVLALIWGRADRQKQSVGFFRNESIQVGIAGIASYTVSLIALPLLAGFDFTSSGLLSRLAGSETGCESRMILWSNVLHLIAQRPYLGWGWGELDYAHYMTLYPGSRFCAILDNAHNLPLHIAVEAGIPTAALVCAVAATLTFRAKPWKEAVPERRIAWSILALIGLHSMLEYPLWYGPFFLSALFCVCVLIKTGQLVRHGRLLFQSKATGVALGSVLIVFAAFMAWDYHRICQIFLPPEQRHAYYRENTLEKIRDSVLFSGYAQFAEFRLTPLSRENAWAMNVSAQQLLHFSPEPSVIERLIESAWLLDREDQAAEQMVRLQTAFPIAFAAWQKRLKENRAPSQQGATRPTAAAQ